MSSKWFLLYPRWRYNWMKNNKWCRWRDNLPWSWYDGKLRWLGHSWAWAVTVCKSGRFYAGLGWGMRIFANWSKGWEGVGGCNWATSFCPSRAVWFESLRVQLVLITIKILKSLILLDLPNFLLDLLKNWVFHEVW